MWRGVTDAVPSIDPLRHGRDAASIVRSEERYPS